MKFAQEAVLKKLQEMASERNTKLKDRKSKGKEDFNDNNMSENDDPYPWLLTEAEKKGLQESIFSERWDRFMSEYGGGA